MRPQLIQETQELAANAPAAMDSILALRTYLSNEIEACSHAKPGQAPTQADRLAVLEKQLRDLDIAIGQVRIYLLGFHRTLASTQASAQGKFKISPQIAKKEKTWAVIYP